MKYIDRHKVIGQYTDADGVLKAAALLRYMQEAAVNAMIADGPSYDELASRGLIFVISRISMSIYADIYANDEIEVETWATESVRASFNRAYRVLRDGAVVAEAVSVWALVDTSRHRLVRVGEVELAYREDEPPELDIPHKLHLPEGMKLIGERRVGYSDIDRNRHMNNTVYPDLLFGALPHREGKRLSELDLLYQKEAPLGDCLQTFYTAAQEDYFLKTVRSDGEENVRARIRLTDVK